MTRDEPLFVAENRVSARSWLAFAGATLAALAAIGAPFLVPEPAAPKLWASIRGPELLCFMGPWVFVCSALALLCALRWANARFGRGELFADRCLLSSPAHGNQVLLPWAEVAGYDDTSRHAVLLHPKETWDPPHPIALLPLAIPTPDEATRVEVLALLERVGLSRV